MFPYLLVRRPRAGSLLAPLPQGEFGDRLWNHRPSPANHDRSLVGWVKPEAASHGSALIVAHSSGQRADEHAVHALRVHLHDLEPKTEQVEGLGDPGYVTKLGDDQAGKGVKFAARKLGEVE